MSTAPCTICGHPVEWTSDTAHAECPGCGSMGPSAVIDDADEVEVDEAERLDDEIRRLRSALERIASARPCTLDPGLPTERSCCMCAALIAEARRALEVEP